jgi:hypothetical protein
MSELYGERVIIHHEGRKKEKMERNVQRRQVEELGET